MAEQFCKICGKTGAAYCKEHSAGFSAKKFDKSFSESTYEKGEPEFLTIFTEGRLRRRINQFINRREHYLFGFLKNKIGRKSKVLDFGCGRGFWAYDLKKELKAKTFGFDISKKAIQYAKRETEKRGERIFFCVADACQLPFKDAAFDAVISQDVLGHLYTPEKGLSESCRILKKNSFFSLHSETSEYRKRHFHRKIIGELSQDPWVFDAGHIGIMPKRALEEKIRKAGFEILKAKSPAQRASFLLNPGDFDRGMRYIHPKRHSQLWFLAHYHRLLKKPLSVPIIAKGIFAANAIVEYIETKITPNDFGGSAYFLLRKR